MNHRFTRPLSAIVAIAAALVLAGCAHYSQIGPGSYGIRGRLDVTLDRGWNRQVEGAGNIWPETWTLNGPYLDLLHIAAGIEDGKALVRLPELRLREFPRFRAGSDPNDIVDLVKGTLARSNEGGDFVLVLVEPAQVAGQDGIRFEFKFGTGGAGGGLETDRHALGYAFEYEKRLYLILFHAAEIHFFPSLRPIAEAIAASARLPQTRTAAR